MNVSFILDEAGSLGQLSVVEDMLTIGRGYGLRIQFYYQSLGQLKKCWPGDEGQTLLSNVSQVFMGINDLPTAEYVSKRLGEATIVVSSGGTSKGSSWQESSPGGKGGSSYSHNTNENWQQAGRPLLRQDEVMALSPREAITFLPGTRPLRTQLVRYYEENLSTSGWFSETGAGMGMVVKAAILLVAAGLMAFAVAMAISKKGERENVRTGEAAVWRDEGSRGRH